MLSVSKALDFGFLKQGGWSHFPRCSHVHGRVRGVSRTGTGSAIHDARAATATGVQAPLSVVHPKQQCTPQRGTVVGGGSMAAAPRRGKRGYGKYAHVVHTVSRATTTWRPAPVRMPVIPPQCTTCCRHLTMGTGEGRNLRFREK